MPETMQTMTMPIAKPIVPKSGPQTDQTPPEPPPPVEREGNQEGPRRLSVSLTGTALMAVCELAERHGISEGDAVRRAVALLKFMSDEEQRGSIVRIQPSHGVSEPFRILFAG